MELRAEALTSLPIDPANPLTDFALSNGVLAVGGETGTVLYDLAEEDVPMLYLGEREAQVICVAIGTFAFSKAELCVVEALANGYIYVHNIQRDCIQTPNELADRITTLAYNIEEAPACAILSPSVSMVAVGTLSGNVYMLSTATESMLASLAPPDTSQSSNTEYLINKHYMCFVSDMYIITLAPGRKAYYIWNLVERQLCYQSFTQHSQIDGVYSLVPPKEKDVHLAAIVFHDATFHILALDRPEAPHLIREVQCLDFLHKALQDREKIMQNKALVSMQQQQGHIIIGPGSPNGYKNYQPEESNVPALASLLPHAAGVLLAISPTPILSNNQVSLARSTLQVEIQNETYGYGQSGIKYHEDQRTGILDSTALILFTPLLLMKAPMVALDYKSSISTLCCDFLGHSDIEDILSESPWIERGEVDGDWIAGICETGGERELVASKVIAVKSENKLSESPKNPNSINFQTTRKKNGYSESTPKLSRYRMGITKNSSSMSNISAGSLQSTISSSREELNDMEDIEITNAIVPDLNLPTAPPNKLRLAQQFRKAQITQKKQTSGSSTPATFHSNVKSSGYGKEGGQRGMFSPTLYTTSRTSTATSKKHNEPKVSVVKYPIDAALPLKQCKQTIGLGDAVISVEHSYDGELLSVATKGGIIRLYKHVGRSVLSEKEPTPIASLTNSEPLQSVVWGSKSRNVLFATKSKIGVFGGISETSSAASKQRPMLSIDVASMAASFKERIIQSISCGFLAYRDSISLVAVGSALISLAMYVRDLKPSDIKRHEQQSTWKVLSRVHVGAQTIVHGVAMNQVQSPYAMLACSSRAIEVWDVSVGRRAFTLAEAHPRAQIRLASCPCGIYSNVTSDAYNLFASCAPGSKMGQVKVWDVRCAAAQGAARVMDGLDARAGALGLAFSPCMRYVLAGSEGARPTYFSLGEGRVIDRLPVHPQTTLDVAFHPARPLVCTGCQDGQMGELPLSLWNAVSSFQASVETVSDDVGPGPKLRYVQIRFGPAGERPLYIHCINRGVAYVRVFVSYADPSVNNYESKEGENSGESIENEDEKGKEKKKLNKFVPLGDILPLSVNDGPYRPIVWDGKNYPGVNSVISLYNLYKTGYEYIEAIRIFLYAPSWLEGEIKLENIQVYCSPALHLEFYHSQLVGIKEKKEKGLPELFTSRAKATKQLLVSVSELRHALIDLDNMAP